MTYIGSDSLGTGFVDAGILVSFTPSVKSRNDALSSILLAQLAADKKFSRFDQAGDWYKFYLNTLGDLAWQISGFQDRQYEPPDDTFTLEEIFLDVLKKFVPDTELRLAQETIRTFAELPREDRRVKVYEDFSLSSYIVDLQVGVSSQSLTLSTVGILLEVKQEIKNLFKEELLVTRLVGKIRTLSYGGTLNEVAYAPLRKAVLTKLGPKRTELILDLGLS
ncbi:MAG TPA: hypothetical protein VJ725_21355 [Thermoanaerobaculia bacterium]|nr:hypothetical protein [Thermoanaerobaculia bacterium]